MKIVLAFDSYKNCLSNSELTTLAAAAIKSVAPQAEISTLRIADGGEGTLEALVMTNPSGYRQTHQVTSLAGKEHSAQIGYAADYCILEAAQTIGFTHAALPPLALRNSYALGTQIVHGLNQGYRQFLLGLGGSGCNDAGVGMLSALGYTFLDHLSQPVEPIPANLNKITTIDASAVDERLMECRFTILSDVNNPLYGATGATLVYGRQKGATAEELVLIEAGIIHFSQLAATFCGYDCSSHPGAGAAGGIGYAAYQFLNATFTPGVDFVLKWQDATTIFSQATVVFTGEGQTDRQTLNGKAVVGIAKLAQQFSLPVLVISGALTPEAYVLHNYGVSYLSSIQIRPTSYQHALHPPVAATLFRHKIEETMRLILLGQALQRCG
jgi:glycerate kinase